jgi:hypothetical protein
MNSERRIATPHGEARLMTHRARRPVVTLLLSHGAGGGVGARDLQAIAAELPRHGASVVLLEQPWRVAGRRIATAPATLDAALLAAANNMRVRTPLVVGGRSAGARSAARSARNLAAAGCLALSFPLHPVGKPESTRLHELRGARVPTLVVQGEQDAMGRPEEFPPDLDLTVVPGADHGLKVAKQAVISQEDAMAIVVESTLEWLVREVIGAEGRRGNGPATRGVPSA